MPSILKLDTNNNSNNNNNNIETEEVIIYPYKDDNNNNNNNNNMKGEGEGEGKITVEEVSKETEISLAMSSSSMYPGFRFSPTDEKLIVYYLHNKIHGFDNCVQVIPLVDICKFEPWDLPAKAIIKSDQEWFFFSRRGKKYPNGSQSKRATQIGYWKATGKERAVKSRSNNVIGTKRTLVFHIGRAPKGERTEWIMHEYCMPDKGQDGLVVCRLKKKSDHHTSHDQNEHSWRPNSSTMSSPETNSKCGLDLSGPSGENNTTQTSMKMCNTSSHDSHSVEQMDCASHSDWKAKDPAKYDDNANNEDDLFAEILNDNIVQLDPTVTTTTTTTISIIPRVYRRSSHPPTFQGTSNRRIRLRKMRRLSPHKEEEDEEEQSGENTVPSPFENMIARSPALKRFWRRNVLRGPLGRPWVRGVGNRLYVVMITVGLLIMFVSYGASPAGLFHLCGYDDLMPPPAAS